MTTTRREATTADLTALLATGTGKDRAAEQLGLSRHAVRVAATSLHISAARRASRTDASPAADGPACLGMDTALFFGRDGERQDERRIREKRAKGVCAGCPVRVGCLEGALERNERHGVLGGMNEDERAAESRRRSRRRRAAA
jgi:WhiB family redox-sensing transcriptional regulator